MTADVPPAAIGFLGAGQMAAALARGFFAAGRLDATRSVASGRTETGRTRFAALTGLRTTPANRDVLAADILILGVKPTASMGSVAAEIAPHLEPRHLVVSIAAGVTLAQLSGWLGASAKVVRVMPNTPCLVGVGASGVSAGANVPAADVATVVALFAAVGEAFEVPEAQIDAVTGLAGSGPAYVFVAIEALADAGVRAGLPRATSQRLAAQTLFGAAKMVLETGTHPAALKDAVASPGGTTIAGLHALEKGGFRAALMDAVAAAVSRAGELGAGR